MREGCTGLSLSFNAGTAPILPAGIGHCQRSAPGRWRDETIGGRCVLCHFEWLRRAVNGAGVVIDDGGGVSAMSPRLR